jgi:hypothetical protein
LECSFINKDEENGGEGMKIDANRIRKIKVSLANIALFLSIFVVLFPLIMPTTNVAAITWYVGGAGPGNFSKIQDAINASWPYDTVYVYPGIYEEILTIDNTGHSRDHLTLQGEDKDTTIVDAQDTGTVITISASWVNVTGFT